MTPPSHATHDRHQQQPGAAAGPAQLSGMHTPGSIWAQAIERQQQQAGSKQASAQGAASVYFVGDAGSGKSTLIARFLQPNQAGAVKPSPGLEYAFVRKAAAAFGAAPSGRQQLAHVWELGGGAGSELSRELTQGSSHVFLTHRQVATAVVVIVLDLSDPASVVPSALHWLGVTRAKLAATYGQLTRRGGGLAQLPVQLQARQRTKVLGPGHADAQLVDVPGVSLVLACAKWDALRDRADPEALRLLSGALRWLAHANAAHLVVVGGQQPGATGSEGPRLLDTFSRLLSHLAFVGMGRKIPLKQQPCFDHLGPLLVPAGADSCSAIGLPHGKLQAPTAGAAASAPHCWSPAEVATGQQAWVDAVAQALPAAGSKRAQQAQRQGGPGPAAAFADAHREEEVDAALALREAALEVHWEEAHSKC